MAKIPGTLEQGDTAVKYSKHLVFLLFLWIVTLGCNVSQTAANFKLKLTGDRSNAGMLGNFSPTDQLRISFERTGSAAVYRHLDGGGKKLAIPKFNPSGLLITR